jgi:hypothetical protein
VNHLARDIDDEQDFAFEAIQARILPADVVTSIS